MGDAGNPRNAFRPLLIRETLLDFLGLPDGWTVNGSILIREIMGMFPLRERSNGPKNQQSISPPNDPGIKEPKAVGDKVEDDLHRVILGIRLRFQALEHDVLFLEHIGRAALQAVICF